MKRWLLVVLLLLANAAHAEEQTVSVPGEGWRIRFDAPKLSQSSGVVPSVFYGSAGRFQLSFFVEKPRCSGPDTDENIYACFLPRVLSNPYVLRESVRANTKPNGVHVMSFARIAIGERVGTNFAIHLLFARNGKWADVHGSFASPRPDDVRELVAIMDSIVVEDEPPPATSPAEGTR